MWWIWSKTDIFIVVTSEYSRKQRVGMSTSSRRYPSRRVSRRESHHEWMKPSYRRPTSAVVLAVMSVLPPAVDPRSTTLHLFINTSVFRGQTGDNIICSPCHTPPSQVHIQVTVAAPTKDHLPSAPPMDSPDRVGVAVTAGVEFGGRCRRRWRRGVPLEFGHGRRKRGTRRRRRVEEGAASC